MNLKQYDIILSQLSELHKDLKYWQLDKLVFITTKETSIYITEPI